jgi:LCP family protein required for cell wall assembly
MTNDEPLFGGIDFDRAPRERRRRKRRRFKTLRRISARVLPRRLQQWVDDNPALAVVIGLLLLLLLIIVLWLLWLWLHLHRAPGFDPDLGDHRPPFLGGENILLVGLDCDESAPKSDALRTCSANDGKIDLSRLDDGNLAATGVRSDVIMVLHVTEDGQHAQVVSIPRDSYVKVDGHGSTKINAAFSYGGPSLLGRTIEQNFKVHLTHIVVTDFNGFRGITDALDGVQVYVPSDVVDTRCNCVAWHQGWQTIKGESALNYVRTRYGLPRGDFDRVQRHQNFLRAVVQRTRSMSVLANPLKVTRLVNEITDNPSPSSSDYRLEPAGDAGGRVDPRHP